MISRLALASSRLAGKAWPHSVKSWLPVMMVATSHRCKKTYSRGTPENWRAIFSNASSGTPTARTAGISFIA